MNHERPARDRLMTRVEVERRIGLKTSKLYKMIRADEFPCPLKISPRAVRWHESEVEAWIASLPRGTGAN